MNKPRVAIDLSMAHCSLGFSGIPQDSRLLFAGLSASETIEITGMLLSCHSCWLGRHLKDSLEEQSVFLGPFLNRRLDQSSVIEKVIRLISARAAHMYRRAARQWQISYALESLLSSLEKNVIWRTFFQSTISPALKPSIIEKDFVISAIGLSRISDGALGRLPEARLNTSNFDIVLFHDSRAVQLSQATKKIIRYHDGLPIFASDTFSSASLVRGHIRSIQRCALNSIFVCNSPSAQEELSRISPKAAERSRVIPYFLPKMSRVESSYNNLLNIARIRISPNTVSNGEEKKILENWFKTNTSTGIPRYIMSLATIEPRKNYPGLISAWRQLRLSTGADIKLMIVGSPGWLYKPILQAMQPFINAGELLHLEKVAQVELSYLYSAAECFAFLSFAEGFGLPPCEAMQCGCPVLVSDLPAHRYSAGDAALYCDPYDTADITAKLRMLLLDKDKDARRQDMIAKGYTNVERFTVPTVLPQWEQFFEEVAMQRGS